MTHRLFAKYADHKIWWRGSNAAWIYFLPDDARDLRDLFVAEPIVLNGVDWAALYAADLTAALAAYDADHQLENAA